MKILIIGDIVGSPGREAIENYLPKKRGEYDFIIVNGENAASGKGITREIAENFFKLGVDVITSGNHIWDKKEIMEYLNGNKKLLRPYNYPKGVPGEGYTIEKSKCGKEVAVVSLQGRTFMNPIDCPFVKGEEIVSKLREKTKFIIVDFHAEATSEKIALGYYLDGKASVVFGTHTHVQTADERVLTEGTGYISDIGMTGSTRGVIGTKKDTIIARFINGLPQKFEVETGDVRLNGISVVLDDDTGECILIERVNIGEAEIKY